MQMHCLFLASKHNITMLEASKPLNNKELPQIPYISGLKASKSHFALVVLVPIGTIGNYSTVQKGKKTEFGCGTLVIRFISNESANGAHLTRATSAIAPPLFLPCQENMYIYVLHFFCPVLNLFSMCTTTFKP